MEYKIRKRAPACTGCERPFEEGATIVSAIFDEADGFLRKDLCERCFDGGANAFSYWRTRQPPAADERHKLDYDLALNFLDRLLREADPGREGLVYTLTLLLSRKRRVKIKETRRLADGELLKVVVPRAEEDELVSVRAPFLDDAKADDLQRELAELFDFGAASKNDG